MSVTQEEYATIAAAIREAEKRTSGQIVCVLARACSDYSYVAVIWAAFLALFAPWPLIAATEWSVQRIFLLQLAVFVVAVLVLAWPPLRMALIPRSVARARAHRAAIEQFHLRGLTRTRNRMGVMIFVSLAERYARIVADEGIASKVPQAEWQSTVDTLTSHMREGHIVPAFVIAIERCGAVLATHAPPDGAADSLPDRLYVI
jgi:putative membrane protein